MYQGYVVLGFYVVCRQWQDRQWQDTFLYSCSNTFFINFCKFCKHWAAATILVVVPNALYLLVVDERLFNDT